MKITLRHKEITFHDFLIWEWWKANSESVSMFSNYEDIKDNQISQKYKTLTI